MPDSRRARIALEVAFLAVVTAVLTAAHVEPAWVVAVLLVAWLLVALLEWVAWNDEPHWASGRPPRYHVPVRRLPPRPPTQELPRFSLYPRPAEGAATWIAPVELREPLPAAAEPAEDDWEPGWPDGHLHDPEADPWTVTELPALPEPEPEPEPVVEVVEVEVVAAEPEPEPVVEVEVVAAEPEPEPESVVAATPPPRVARHHLDPFEQTMERRWPWQRVPERPPTVEVPALPRHPVGGRR